LVITTNKIEPNSAILRSLQQTFVCRQIKLSDRNNSCSAILLSKYHEAMINMSDVILVVCSNDTADDFSDTTAPSWANDTVHPMMLSLISAGRNRRKLVPWSADMDGVLLEWIKIHVSCTTTHPPISNTGGSDLLKGMSKRTRD
jgi:hypothetical protein